MSQLILIVDDDAELRLLYRMILEREGYTVAEAANGMDALRFLSTQTPDLIIMDVLMPLLGGEGVMRKLQQMPVLNNVRVIVLTAYPRFRDSALLLHADQFLVKPVTPQQIVAAVRATLAGQSYPDE